MTSRFNSKKYQMILDDYHENHTNCPKCNYSSNLSIEENPLFKYDGNRSSWESIHDLKCIQKIECKCGFKGIVHDLIKNPIIESTTSESGYFLKDLKDGHRCLCRNGSIQFYYNNTFFNDNFETITSDVNMKYNKNLVDKANHNFDIVKVLSISEMFIIAQTIMNEEIPLGFKDNINKQSWSNYVFLWYFDIPREKITEQKYSKFTNRDGAEVWLNCMSYKIQYERDFEVNTEWNFLCNEERDIIIKEINKEIENFSLIMAIEERKSYTDNVTYTIRGLKYGDG